MSLHRFLGLASIALVVGCARTDAIQPVALPFAFAPTDEPPPPEAPLRTLEGLAAAPANAAIAPDLLRLMATETDARCRAYLDAGARGGYAAAFLEVALERPDVEPALRAVLEQRGWRPPSAG